MDRGGGQNTTKGCLANVLPHNKRNMMSIMLEIKKCY